MTKPALQVGKTGGGGAGAGAHVTGEPTLGPSQKLYLENNILLQLPMWAKALGNKSMTKAEQEMMRD